MSTTIPTHNNKCRGAMLATAIGDALGWPNEIRSNNKSKGTCGGENLWHGFDVIVNLAITMRKFYLENTVMILN